MPAPVRDRRQLRSNLVLRHVEQEMQILFVGREAGDGAREEAEIDVMPGGRRKPWAIPRNVWNATAGDRTTREEVAAGEAWVATSKCDELPRKAKYLAIGLDKSPVEPRDLVVLAVRVVVAALGMQHLVAREQHRHTAGEHEERKEVSRLAAAHAQHPGVRGIALDPAVPAQVVV